MATIIDAKNLILGRMASRISRRALLGESFDVVNCEQAIITGSKKDIMDKYVQRRQRGTPTTGPYTERRPEMLVRRTIRGMLPYKKERGRKAFSRIRCHRGVPKSLQGKETESIEAADMKKLPMLKYITIKELCRNLGAK